MRLPYSDSVENPSAWPAYAWYPCAAQQIPKTAKQHYELGMWVRPRTGVYKDDLARIFEVS